MRCKTCLYTLQAPKSDSEGKSRQWQHCCSPDAEKVAQELLAAEKAKLAEAAARRQKKAQKKSKQKRKKELHLAAEVPQEDAEDTVLAADKASNNGAGPSTSSDVAPALEVWSLARGHCVGWSRVRNADAEIRGFVVLARVAGISINCSSSYPFISLTREASAVSAMGGSFMCLRSW